MVTCWILLSTSLVILCFLNLGWEVVGGAAGLLVDMVNMVVDMVDIDLTGNIMLSWLLWEVVGGATGCCWTLEATFLQSHPNLRISTITIVTLVTITTITIVTLVGVVIEAYSLLVSGWVFLFLGNNFLGRGLQRLPRCQCGHTEKAQTGNFSDFTRWRQELCPETATIWPNPLY